MSAYFHQATDGKYRAPRTLVLCFDGTNDVFDEDPTNIIRIFGALEKNMPSEQVVYYQPGIGTYVRADAPWSPAVRGFAKTIDKGLAWYISTHITGGYKFLMQHYSAGDRICLFGFSRGAYTARCLAGMLHKVGLLPRSNMEQVEFAYALYESRKLEDIPKARLFKETFSQDVSVEFIGVWDTVSSVGLGAPLLPFNASETFIKTFRHALALDERRVKFQPNAWQYKQKCPECGSRPRAQGDDDTTHINQLTKGCKREPKESAKCWCQDESNHHGGHLTDILEVWFPGFHADVGGGNEKLSQRTTLANPSLRWMVTEVLKSKCGVIFKRDAFRDWLPSLNLKIRAFEAVSSKDPVEERKSADAHCAKRTCSHQEHDGFAVIQGTLTPLSTPGTPPAVRDEPLWEPSPEDEALAKMNDMIWAKPLWWILEYLPLYQYWLEKDKQTGEWKTGHGLAFNCGRIRKVDQLKPKFHRSVEWRQHHDHDYKPGDRCTFGAPTEYYHEDDDWGSALTEEKKVQLKASAYEAYPDVARLTEGEDIVTIGGKQYCKNPIHWYEDGSVGFLVETIAFRVHGGILSRKSQVMHNLLNPLRSSSGTHSQLSERSIIFDGVPFIRLHDKAIDFAHVLTLFMYNHYPPKSRGPNLNEKSVMGIIRFATKYMMDDARFWAVSRLAADYPMRIQDLHSRPFSVHYITNTQGAQDYIDIIKFARECSLPEYLPLAFYALATWDGAGHCVPKASSWGYPPREIAVTPQTFYFFRSTTNLHHTLSPEDQHRLHQGRIALQKAIVQKGFGVAETLGAEERCCDNGCFKDRDATWEDTANRWAQLLLHPLEELDMRCHSLYIKLCERCAGNVKRTSAEFRDELASQLVVFFNLEGEFGVTEGAGFTEASDEDLSNSSLYS
ncbi:hypothetical protein FRB90_012149 [Tulasnella sp. 427]|nr:hypothetical protein FRB90_012149 [Tulasnella sp. 427]